MKTEIKTKTVSKEVEYKTYISYDGKEFTDRDECVLYESELKESELKKLKNFKEADEYVPCDGESHLMDTSYCWYMPKDAEDIAILNRCYNFGGLYSCNDSSYDLSNDDIGELLCIEHYENYDVEKVSYVSDCIRYVKDLFSKLGYEVSITKKDGGQNA